MWSKSEWKPARGVPRQECRLKSPTDGSMLTPLHSAPLLADTFFPRDDRGSDTMDHIRIREEAAAIRGVARASPEPADFTAFTHGEVNAGLDTMNPNKVPGIEGITSDICQRVHRETPVLLAIYNRCLRLSYFPVIWKRAWIRVIPKPGKADYSAPKAYHPIGLLPVMGKILEKLIVNRLSWELFQGGGVSRGLYGFVPQISTEDALSDAISYVRKGVKSKNLVAMVSLDIEGAFDGGWWPSASFEREK